MIAALVLLVALITASLYKMVNKPLDGSGSDASSASSDIVIADGEAYDGTMDNGKTDSEEMRFIEFPAFTTIYVSPDSTVDLVNPESNHVYFKYTILENDEVLCQQPRLNRFAGYRRGLRGNPQARLISLGERQLRLLRTPLCI